MCRLIYGSMICGQQDYWKPSGHSLVTDNGARHPVGPLAAEISSLEDWWADLQVQWAERANCKRGPLQVQEMLVS